MIRSPLRSRWTAAVAVACGALLLGGCGGAPHAAGSAAAGTSAGLSVDPALADALPADVRASGRLRIVTEASYAPASSFGPDGRTIIGFEPDLAKALGAVLGLQVTVTNAGFDELPELVTSRKADLIMSAMTDTRQRERSLDFVNYFSAGTAILVQRGNPKGVTALGDLCGQPVAVQRGTVQVELVRHAQANCPAGTAILLRTFPTNDDALLQLRTGRVTAVLNDYPPAAALTTDPATGARFQLASTAQYEPGWYGIGVAKRRQQLRNAVQGALQKLLDTGRYRAVLRAWNVADGAVLKATINAGAAQS